MQPIPSFCNKNIITNVYLLPLSCTADVASMRITLLSDNPNSQGAADITVVEASIAHLTEELRNKKCRVGC